MNRKKETNRDRVRRQHDLAIEAQLYLERKTLKEIAEIIGVSASQISYDMKLIRKAWLDSAVRDFDAAMAEELARLDAIETTARRQFEKSCQDREKRHTATEESDKDGAKTKADLTVEQSAGDARFLQIALQCVEARMKILAAFEVKRQGRPIPPPQDTEADRQRKANIEAWQYCTVEELEQLAKIREAALARKNAPVVDAIRSSALPAPTHRNGSA